MENFHCPEFLQRCFKDDVVAHMDIVLVVEAITEVSVSLRVNIVEKQDKVTVYSAVAVLREKGTLTLADLQRVFELRVS